MTDIVETRTGAGCFLVSEANGHRSRDGGTIKAGADLMAGTVLGRIAAALEATAAAKAGGNAANTGALTLDATTPVLAGAKVGVYKVRCITAATNGGTFRVTDPDGDVIGDVAVGATFANQLKFSISDGSQDWIVGEGFDVTVSADTDATDIGKLAAIDFDATDGTAVAAAILWDAARAATADVRATLVTRDAEVVAEKLVWPTGATSEQKAAALAQLAALGIIAR